MADTLTLCDFRRGNKAPITFLRSSARRRRLTVAHCTIFHINFAAVGADRRLSRWMLDLLWRTNLLLPGERDWFSFQHSAKFLPRGFGSTFTCPAISQPVRQVHPDRPLEPERDRRRNVRAAASARSGECSMSALPPKADIFRGGFDVR